MSAATIVVILYGLAIAVGMAFIWRSNKRLLARVRRNKAEAREAERRAAHPAPAE